MSEDITRRDALGKVVRGAVLLGIGGGAGYLVQKAHGQIVWQVDAVKCVNSRLGEVGAEVCRLCTSECVVSQSAVRAPARRRAGWHHAGPASAQGKGRLDFDSTDRRGVGIHCQFEMADRAQRPSSGVDESSWKRNRPAGPARRQSLLPALPPRARST